MDTTKYLESFSGLKIAIVTETWEPEINGVAVSIGRMAQGFLTKGCSLQLFRPEQQEESAKLENVDEYLTKGFRLPFYKQVRLGLPAGRLMKKVWKESRPDVVIIVTEGALGLSGLRAAKHLNIPVISEFHTHFEKYSQFYHMGALLKLAQYYLRWLHKQADLTLVATKSLQQELRADGFGHLAVLARGVDSELFNPVHRSQSTRKLWGVNEDQLVVIFVGRLAAEKNIQLAIKAFRAIQQVRDDARFVLVGDGPLRSKLEPKYPDFLFCGMQTGVALAEHYASADLFLMPSTTETFGNTLLEAMSSQLGVVAYDYAAAVEHVQDSENGLKVTLDDEKAFIAAAKELAKRDSYRLKLAENARKTTELVSWESITLTYLSLINELIASEVQRHDALGPSTQSD